MEKMTGSTGSCGDTPDIHRFEKMKKMICRFLNRGIPVLILLLVLSACGGAGASPGKEAAGQGTAGKEASGKEVSEKEVSEKEAAGEGATAAPSADVEEGLLRIGLVEEVDTMDVHRTTSAYMVPINVFERLYDIRLNDDGTTDLVPGLAEDYSLSKDGRTYTFTLRDNAFFSDGTRVTASDVAFTFTRMLALPESLQTDFADMILGAEDVMAGKSDTLKGIKVIDDTHLAITLKEPFAGYVSQTATPSCSILSEKCVRESGEAFGTSPETTIGSGPYMVTEFSGGRIVLELNPYYTKETPSVKKADLLNLDPALMDRTFREGGLDLLDTEVIHPDTIKNVYKSDAWKDRVLSKGCVETNYLMLNLETAPLDNVRVRKAVQMAIDRQKILDELYDGEGTLVDGIFPRGLIGFCEENQGWLHYDPEAARRILARGGVKKGSRIEIAANSTSSVRDLNMLNMIRDDLEAVGLEATIVNYDPDSRMYLRNEGRLMAYTGVWSADYNDPDNFIYTFFGSREKTRGRSGNFSDQEVMDRITKARSISDEKERAAEYAALEKLLIRDRAVWVPLFSTNHLYVLGDRVEKFVPYWAGWNSFSIKDVVLK